MNRRRVGVVGLVGGIVFTAGLAVAAPALAAGDKIDICHFSSHYDAKPVSVDQITGPNGHGKETDDIIPPFDYEDGHYPGHNWTAAGQAIWNDGKCDGNGSQEPPASSSSSSTDSSTSSSSSTDQNSSSSTDQSTSSSTEESTSSSTEESTSSSTEESTSSTTDESTSSSTDQSTDDSTSSSTDESTSSSTDQSTDESTSSSTDQSTSSSTDQSTDDSTSSSDQTTPPESSTDQSTGSSTAPDQSTASVLGESVTVTAQDQAAGSAQVNTPAPIAPSSGTDHLARTGSGIAKPMAALGALTIGLGTGLVVVATRRRRALSQP